MPKFILYEFNCKACIVYGMTGTTHSFFFHAFRLELLVFGRCPSKQATWKTGIKIFFHLSRKTQLCGEPYGSEKFFDKDH